MYKHFITLVSTFSLCSASYAYEGPSPLRDIKVAASVKMDSSTNQYQFSYSITNPSSNDGDISSIDIFLPFDPKSEVTLSSDSFTHCSRYHRHTSQASFSKYPIVPVGSSAPAGWSCGYGHIKEYTDGVYGWGSDEKHLLKHGTSMSGFMLRSYGLPGIRNILVQPDVNLEQLPSDYNENVEKTIALENSVKWMGKTIGPKAPPKVFVGSDFLSDLIAMANQSRTNNWIDSDGILSSLLAKLNDAAKKLSAGDKKAAKNVLNAFLQEVQAQNGKHLTAEAYSLLYYNGKYLVDRL